MKDLENSWRDAFNDLQAYVDETDYKVNFRKSYNWLFKIRVVQKTKLKIF